MANSSPDSATPYPKQIQSIKVRNSLECNGTGDNILSRTAIAKALRSVIFKWDHLKLKSDCKANNTIYRMKWQTIYCDKKHVTPTYDR